MANGNKNGRKIAGETKTVTPPPLPVGKPPPGAKLTTSTGTDDLVRVIVPKMASPKHTFNFVTPDHQMHNYAAGEQNMRRSIAESQYARSHGIEIIGEAE